MSATSPSPPQPPSFFVRAYDVDHAGHPALGYAIVSRTTSGLKEEYRGLDGPAMRDLARSGVSVRSDPIEVIEVGYTGDTCARGLTARRTRPRGDDDDDDDADYGATSPTTTTTTTTTTSTNDIGQLFRAELLFCELTYLDSSDDEHIRNVASERGHMHINDLEGVFASHDDAHHREDGGVSENGASSPIGDVGHEYPTNAIVFYHLSARYRPASRALDLISEGLPRRLSRGRVRVAVSSLLSPSLPGDGDRDSIAELVRPCGCVSLAEYLEWRDARTTTTTTTTTLTAATTAPSKEISTGNVDDYCSWDAS